MAAKEFKLEQLLDLNELEDYTGDQPMKLGAPNTTMHKSQGYRYISGTNGSAGGGGTGLNSQHPSQLSFKLDPTRQSDLGEPS